MAGNGVSERCRFPLALLLATILSGCISNPKVSAERKNDGAWALGVTACSYSGERSEVVDELNRQAAKRCRHGWEVVDRQVNDRVMLGNAVFGECPAVRVSATVLCKERE